MGNPTISSYQVTLAATGNVSQETKAVTVDSMARGIKLSPLLPGVSYTVSVRSLTTLTSSVEEGEPNTAMADTLLPQGECRGSIQKIKERKEKKRRRGGVGVL